LDYAYSNPQQSAVALESVFQVIHMMRYKYEVNFHANTMIQLETILDETIQQVLNYSETAEDSSYKRTLIMNSIMACKKLINNMKTL
jgi:hydrogenase maturation factor HypF (carbamoyltransferase family)